MGTIWRLLALGTLALVLVSSASAEDEHRLKPADTSSPRATLATFMDGTDDVLRYLRDVYIPSQTRENHETGASMMRDVFQCFDLSETPPAARTEIVNTVAASLYETLSRIELPSPESIPDESAFEGWKGPGPARWRVPNTDIQIVQVQEGPRAGEFLFSPSTVSRANEFYLRVRSLPYRRAVPIKNLMQLTQVWGGWMIPLERVRSLPSWLHRPIASQSLWKWLMVAILFVVTAVVLIGLGMLTRRVRGERVVLRAVLGIVTPAAILIVTPGVLHLALIQVNLTGSVANVVKLLGTAVMTLGGAALALRLARAISVAIISSPRVDEESVTAHLVELISRVAAMGMAVAIILIGGNQIGLPLLGVIASLGVGGLALALAAQPTIENLMGSLNLYADRPVSVGDFCRYGDREGYVEAIGLRSTRIRGRDRTLTTIPNSEFSKTQIVNYSRRDRQLIQTTLGLRYETTSEQLRFVLAELRKMLLAHTRVRAKDLRVRFVGFGAYSVDIEIFAYLDTAKWVEFLAIREDVLLRIIDVVEQAGTGFAFPSQTMYMAQDRGLDGERSREAEATVQGWRADGELPFPEPAPRQIKELRGTLSYPPQGSAVGKPESHHDRD